MKFLELIKQNKLFDSHSHLADEQFFHDWAKVVENAKESGLSAIISVSTKGTDAVKHVSTKKNSSFIFPTVGYHPDTIISDYNNLDNISLAKIKAELEKAVQKFNPIMIGECGIDFYWVKKTIPEKLHNKVNIKQQELFILQLELAQKYNLPVTVHTRDSLDLALLIVSAFPKVTVVFHSFTGNYTELNKILSSNHFIGLNGIITFNSAKDLKAGILQFMQEKKIKKIKDFYDERILFESDAPYLAPEGFRGKRNEPSYIKNVFEFLSS